MPDIEPDVEEMPLEKEAVVTDMSKPDEADVSKEIEQSADATSSTAEDASKPAAKDTLSIVRDVVGEKPAEASSAKDAEKDGQQPDAEAKDEQDEFAEVPFNKHPRWKAVVDELKEKRVDATRYKNVENFISEQGLAAEEAAELLRAGGLMKTNPVEAWKVIKPKIQALLVAAGEVLSDDLKQRRDNGELTHEAALEISRSRAALQSGQARQEFEIRQTQTRQSEEIGAQVKLTVADWHDERRRRDPNFDAKLPLIEKEVLWLQRKDGMPNSLKGIQAQLDKAYTAASESYRPPRPKPAVNPIPSGQPAANVQPAKPKTTLDIIKSVVAQRTA